MYISHLVPPMFSSPRWCWLTSLVRRSLQTLSDSFCSSKVWLPSSGRPLLVSFISNVLICNTCIKQIFVSGFMFDAYNSYNEGLILMGAFIAISGLMLYPIPCIRQALEKVKGSSFCCICSYFFFLDQRQSRGFSKCATEQSIIRKDAKISIEQSQDPEERIPII